MIRAVAVVVLAAAVLAAPVAAAGGGTRTIALVTKGKVRAAVTAHETSGGKAPTAAITVIGYRSAAGHRWQRTRTQRLTGTFFWKTVTGPLALCRIVLSGSTLTISVRVTPSIGCGRTNRIALG